MFGLFLENGPLRVVKNGPGADDYLITMTESWVDLGDMVIVDRRGGTGFSFGKSLVDRMVSGYDQIV